MKPVVSLRSALEDPGLLGPVLGAQSWWMWRLVMLACMGEPLTIEEREAFRSVTGGRTEPPLSRVEEALFLVGRRGGKDRAASVLATYIAGLCDHSDALVPGERGIVLLIAPDQRQATITLDYIEAAFHGSPMLSTLVRERVADVLRLTNGVDIEVRAASFRRLRGLTCLAIIASEAAFWNVEGSANADADILASVRPALATTGGPLVLITTPRARRGEVWELFRRHYGPGGDPRILIVRGEARQFNPTLPQSVIDRALERDHAAASAEFLAQFRSDLEAFLSLEVVEAVVDRGCRERAPAVDHRYFAHVDPSGGAHDDMALAVAHKQGEVVVLDAVRSVSPPFSPDGVVTEFARLLRAYRVATVHGDKYAGEWPRERFRVAGIQYQPADLTTSETYIEMLPLLNASKVRLLDHPKLVHQLCGLERRAARLRDTVDHPPGAHDDIAAAVAGALVVASKPVPQMFTGHLHVAGLSSPAPARNWSAYRDEAGKVRLRKRPQEPERPRYGGYLRGCA